MENTQEKAAFSIEGGCRYLDVSRPTFYRLMDQGLISSFHIGRRRLVLRADLDRFIQERLAEAAEAR